MNLIIMQKIVKTREECIGTQPANPCSVRKNGGKMRMITLARAITACEGALKLFEVRYHDQYQKNSCPPLIHQNLFLFSENNFFKAVVFILRIFKAT